MISYLVSISLRFVSQNSTSPGPAQLLPGVECKMDDFLRSSIYVNKNRDEDPLIFSLSRDR